MTKNWAEYFDALASEEEDHKKVGLSEWGSNAVYTMAEKYIEGRILDIGCGSGALAYINPDREIIGIDISPKQVENASRYCEAYVASIENLPFPDKFFDSVVSLAVIQNCSVPLKRQIEEMVRVSKDTVFLSGLSTRYEKETPLKKHDPVEVLKTLTSVVGKGVFHCGAIKYKEEKVWVEDWNQEGTGLFYIALEIM